jgi:hypothetical protein
MSSVITAGNATNNGASISSDSTGILAIKTGTGAGTTALTLDASQNATFAGTVSTVTGTVYPLVSSTAQASTSGTSIDFTGIPSTAKRVTIMFNGVSTSGTSALLVQIGSGSITTTGYSSQASNGASGTQSAIGMILNTASVAANSYYGIATILNVSGNIYIEAGNLAVTSTIAGYTNGGGVTLSGALDRVRITTVNGTDTFDAGSINILWE